MATFPIAAYQQLQAVAQQHGATVKVEVYGTTWVVEAHKEGRRPVEMVACGNPSLALEEFRANPEFFLSGVIKEWKHRSC